MHRSSLHACLVGLAACVRPSPRLEPPPRTEASPVGEALAGAEPSGLNMDRAPASAEDGARFMTEPHQWCSVLIDPRGRPLQLTHSFLQAWNLIAAGGRPDYHGSEVPRTESDARRLACGDDRCTIERPLLVRATAGGKAGIGVLIPSPRGMLVAPLGGEGLSCLIPGELHYEQAGGLVHATTITRDGEYERTYFHGEIDEVHGYVPAYGRCEPVSTTRTDIVIDPESGELELTLTQIAPREQVRPLVEVRLEVDEKNQLAAKLEGCNDVLELRWSG